MIEKFDVKSHVRMFGKAVIKMREHLRLSTEELAERSGQPVFGIHTGGHFMSRQLGPALRSTTTTPDTGRRPSNYSRSFGQRNWGRFQRIFFQLACRLLEALWRPFNNSSTVIFSPSATLINVSRRGQRFPVSRSPMPVRLSPDR